VDELPPPPRPTIGEQLAALQVTVVMGHKVMQDSLDSIQHEVKRINGNVHENTNWRYIHSQEHAETSGFQKGSLWILGGLVIVANLISPLLIFLIGR
jgi:hypothetical protein